ncbi:MAG: sel1 repeat family protein [Betaproteobacteria bacterium]|nr:sel1 repeat family protein [Betaproteobacteria bacterium]
MADTQQPSNVLRQTSAPRSRVLVLLAGLSAVAWLLFAVLEAQGAEDPETLVKQGDRAYSRGDMLVAMASYREAAEAGHAPAQVRLGYVLDQAEENVEAARWYERAAQQGLAEGLYRYGQLHITGEGVKRDVEKGVALVQRAAEGGFVLAHLTLARGYESGTGGLRRDDAKARSHWNRAADLGDRSAMERLAAAARGGELGMPPDAVAAQDWEKRLRALRSGASAASSGEAR